MNLVHFLDATAARTPDAPALTQVSNGTTLTYGQLAREVHALGDWLAARGVRSSTRVGLVCADTLAHVPAAFAILAAGGCLVPVAHNLTEAEAGDVLDRIDVELCLTQPGQHEAVNARRAPGTADDVVTAGVCAGFSFTALDPPSAPPPAFADCHPAFVRFSSGTTGRSKGVVLSHEAVAARVEASDAVLCFTGADRLLWVLPLAYHFAVTIVAYVRAGAHVLLAPDIVGERLLNAMREHRATVFYGSPLHVARLASVRGDARPEHLRLCLSTAAPISPETIAAFEARHGIPVAQAYGIIEAGLPCLNVRTDDSSPVAVGVPVPGYDVAVLDEDGQPVAAGESGQVGLKGPGLFSAYYAPWCSRAQASSSDGWFMTGDLGRFDEGGALHLVGRSKAIIVTAGMKVHPEEVETRLDGHPAVRASRVLGRVHAAMGEIPVAEVEPVDGNAAPTAAALRAWCRETLSAYKIPMQFDIVDAVPRTRGGKILRR